VFFWDHTQAQEREKLDGFKTMGSGALADIKKMKNKQIEKLDQEALEDAEEGAALQEDLELPLKLLSGWDPKDPGAPSNDGEAMDGLIVGVLEYACAIKSIGVSCAS